MNRIELLQRASTESVPVLRKVTERLRQLFPELKLRPNALERTPNADTFMTTNLRRQFGEIESIENDFVNAQTQKVENKIQSSCTDSLKRKEYKLQEIGENEKVINDLDVTDLDGFQIGTLRQYEYGHGKNPIKETIYNSDGSKQILIRNEHGNVLSKEDIPKNFARTKTEFHGDGSKTRTVYQTVGHAQKPLGQLETVEEYTSTSKVSKITQKFNDETESFVELNPKTGSIIRLEVPNLSANGKGHTRLKIEYEPEHPGVCKSIEVTNMGNGRILYSARYKDGIPEEISGFVVDNLNRYSKHSIEDIARWVGTPDISLRTSRIQWDGFDRHYALTPWKEDILFHTRKIGS